MFSVIQWWLRSCKNAAKLLMCINFVVLVLVKRDGLQTILFSGVNWGQIQQICKVRAKSDVTVASFVVASGTTS